MGQWFTRKVIRGQVWVKFVKKESNRVVCTVVPERLTHFRYPQNPENVSIFPEKKFNYEK